MSSTGFRDVSSLLAPRSITITGAAPTPGNWAVRIAEELDRYSYAGPVTLVSPKHGPVPGRVTVERIEDVTTPLDHVVALVPAPRTVEVLETAGSMGARSATVIAAGFDELGTAQGRELGAALLDVAARHDIALCGPNCMGFLSYAAGVSTFAERYPRKTRRGSLGLVSQSGGMMGAIMRHIGDRGIGLAHAISTGNELNRDVADFMSHLASDPETKAVALVLEGVRRPEEFIRACELLHQAGKPLIVLQSGRTERGQEAVKSHTGVLAAGGKTTDAVLRAVNAIQVDSVAELVEVAELATRIGPPPAPGLAVIALSGGAKNMIVDVEDDFDLPFATLTPKTLAALDGTLPVGTTVGNPMDIGMVGLSAPLRPTFLHVLDTLASDPGVGLIAIQDELPGEDPPPSHLEGMAEAADVVTAHGRELVFFSRAKYQMLAAEQTAHDTLSAPALQDVHDAMRAIGRILAYHNPSRAADALPLSARIAEDRISAPITAVVDTEIALDLLRTHDVPVAPYAVARTSEHLAAYTGAWPTAVKVVDDDIEHKSDVGGVHLNVPSAQAATQALQEMQARFGGDRRYLIQEMVTRGLLEIFVSCYRDPQFGWILLIGVGGLWAEPLATVHSTVLPRTREAVQQAVDDSVIGRILRSPRGRRLLDPKPIYDAIEAVCATAADAQHALTRVEINPLVADGDRCIAVDIVMEAARPVEPTEQPLEKEEVVAR